MKEWFARHKKLAISLTSVIAVAVIAAAAVILIVRNGSRNPDGEDPVVKEPDEKMEFTFYQSEQKYLEDPTDVGVMIMDCDEDSYFGTLTNASVTRKKGRYVQGTGALKIASLLNTTPATGYFKGVDISAYEEGSIHVSLYVSAPEFLGGPIYLEISSSGTYDKEELCWEIPQSALKSGWNELYLGMENAIRTGEARLSEINYFRLYTIGAKMGLDVGMDCVYATNTPGMTFEKTAVAGQKAASTKQGYLMDCDTLDGLASNGTFMLSTAKGEYKEGKGAVIVSNPNLVWLMANLQPADISACQNGKISFWVYVNDASYVKNGKIYLELTSSGTFDKNEMCWRFPGSDLKTGWNEVVLNMAAATQTADGVDLTNINYLRMYGMDCDKNLLVIIDALRVIPPTKRVPSDGMLLNCDTKDGLKIVSENTFAVTNAAGEYKEGTGAFKSTGAKDAWWQVQMEEVVDVSAYKDGGIHLWLYIDDPTKLGSAAYLELTSSGKFDVDEYQWSLSGLKKGWNELKLSFEDASVTGNPDLGNVNYLRIFAKCNGEITAILDDVRAIHIEKKTPIPGLLFSCDDMEGLKLVNESAFRIADGEGEYKEGTGAFWSTGKGQSRFAVKLNKPLDISAYKDGSLQFWMYIGDRSEFASTTFTVELTSGGTFDKQELNWNGNLSDLKENSWNHILLSFEKAGKSGGDIDFTKVNYFRLYLDKFETSEKVIVSIDDVRAVTTKPAPEPEPEPEPKPSVPGMILDCDTTTGMKVTSGSTFSIANAEGEYKEGTAAFRSMGKGQVRFMVKLDDPVDISAYKDGTLQFWMYVGNKAEFESTRFTVELTSSGTYDTQELNWSKNLTELEDNSWNLITLKFAEAGKQGDEIDLTKVNFFRLYLNKDETSDKVIVSIDEVRAVEAEKEPEQVSSVKLLNCDSVDGLISITEVKLNVATQAGQFKEGTGAFVSNGTLQQLWNIKMTNPVDISACKDGKLHFWLYIEDTSKWKGNVRVEIGSAGVPDQEELEWQIPIADLKNGWNEVYLDFGSPMSKAGIIDMTRINHFRIYQSAGASTDPFAVIVDDICAVKSTQILKCDDPSEVANSVTVTKDPNFFKEGLGAFYLSGIQQVRWAARLSNPVDISGCKDGKLHFWFYIDDISKWNGQLIVEINSSGQFDKNELQWNINPTTLKSGWNEMSLPFASAIESAGNEMDRKSVKYLRIFQAGGNARGDVKTSIDDISAVAY